MSIAVLFLTLGIGSYASKNLIVENYMETGFVKIHLEQTSVGEKSVLPGESISMPFTIENKGAECFLRTKVLFDEESGITDKQIQGFATEWIKKRDGYYYYRKSIKPQEKLYVFQELQIPEELKECEGENFINHIQVDAIQAKNFQPDFSKELPWGNVSVTDYKKDGKFVAANAEIKIKIPLVIEFQDEMLEKSPDDFFCNIPALMPGDTYSDTITFKNTADKGLRLFFESEILENSFLLNEIDITITTEIGGEKEYVKPKNNEKILLAHLSENQEGTMDFKIHVPEEANNSYASENGRVKWTFSTEILEKEAAKTSDSNLVGILLTAAFVSLGLIILLESRKRQ